MMAVLRGMVPWGPMFNYSISTEDHSSLTAIIKRQLILYCTGQDFTPKPQGPTLSGGSK